jgi:hypothetical protein
MDEETIFGIFAISSIMVLLGLAIVLGILANNSNNGSDVWKQAVQRGYAEELQTSKGSAYVWKD